MRFATIVIQMLMEHQPEKISNVRPLLEKELGTRGCEQALSYTLREVLDELTIGDVLEFIEKAELADG